MKKTIVLLMCAAILAGCSTSEYDFEKEAEREEEIEVIKSEIYKDAYKEGYEDALEATLEEIPDRMIGKEELEEALYRIFEDGEYAEEIRDQILSDCNVYDPIDLVGSYTDSAMDYDY